MKKGKAFRRGVVLAAILAVAAIAAAACGDDAGSDGSADAREVSVRASDDLRFEPSEIRLKVGESVRLRLENMGLSAHDITVDDMPMMGGGSGGMAHDMGDGMDMSEYAMHLSVESHRDGMMEFTPTEPGTYTYYCTVNGHRDAGMQGKMIVE